MADRTSAEIFGSIFELLAEDPTDHHKNLARKFWRMSDRYDFHPCQMECDEALETLGLARPDPDEDGCFKYGPERKRNPKNNAPPNIPIG